ncbi:pyrroloquinoline-quinone synthase PqqC [Caldimonas tepidiphila]|uniref:pyrroloquinoline-quinone synthase PqqC n=1 Tax=Caldimonas tepidiphila TaxID=2315841 RepID=UPI000E5BDD64|nr:pyrroloquinoline-quinone synthase PqqC [Caldimonas tepidiphila]
MREEEKQEAAAWPAEEFERQLRAQGARYHIHHPFHRRMHEGLLAPEQIRDWVANRFYYQINIPRKDAAILANCPDREARRRWIQRIEDHDGRDGDEGGIEAWVALGETVGLSREEIWSQRRVQPGVRFAVDAYVNFARSASWQEAACSSLTELFAPHIHQSRLDSWPQRYPWIRQEGLRYFRSRLTQARRDVEHGLQVTLEHFRTREQQDRAMEILSFKLDVLWSMADAIMLGCSDVSFAARAGDVTEIARHGEATA